MTREAVTRDRHGPSEAGCAEVGGFTGLTSERPSRSRPIRGQVGLSRRTYERWRTRCREDVVRMSDALNALLTAALDELETRPATRTQQATDEQREAAATAFTF